MRSREAQDALGSIQVQTLVETSDLLGAMPVLGIIEERLHGDACMTDNPPPERRPGMLSTSGHFAQSGCMTLR